jgi:hypothetical protein
MDTWPDDPELQAWRQAYRDLQGRGSPTCPPDDRLIALVLHETPQAERAQLADHIVRCRRCTALSQLLLRVHRALTETLPEPAPPVSATTGRGVQRNGARGDQKTLKPPQQATCSRPNGHDRGGASRGACRSSASGAGEGTAQ